MRTTMFGSNVFNGHAIQDGSVLFVSVCVVRRRLFRHVRVAISYVLERQVMFMRIRCGCIARARSLFFIRTGWFNVCTTQEVSAQRYRCTRASYFLFVAGGLYCFTDSVVYAFFCEFVSIYEGFLWSNRCQSLRYVL